MYYLEILLIQVLFVMLPALVYHALLKTIVPSVKIKPYIFGILSCISIGLLLLFPIELGEGRFLDLRFVSWYLSFIYGNFYVGLFVTAFFVIFRFLIGGIGMYYAFGVIVVFLPVLFYISKTFHLFTYKKKLVISSIILSVITLSQIISGLIIFPVATITAQKVIIYSMYIVANGFTVWIMVYLEEMIRSKELMYLELQRLDKLQVVGQMAASFAHEIRNPMTTVRGFLQLLGTSAQISADEKKYIRVSIDELDRAHDIIKDYLSLAKENQHMKKLERINVEQEISYVISTLNSFAIISGVTITFQSFNQPIFVRGAVSDFRQLLLNLIKNGIESMQDKGEIIITRTINGNYASITITDQGAGMNQEQLDRLGLPFYSTKEKGTGLGLMLCYNIVHSMDGKIKFTSEIGKGTTVSIHLPAISG